MSAIRLPVSEIPKELAKVIGSTPLAFATEVQRLSSSNQALKRIAIVSLTGVLYVIDTSGAVRQTLSLGHAELTIEYDEAPVEGYQSFKVTESGAANTAVILRMRPQPATLFLNILHQLSPNGNIELKAIPSMERKRDLFAEEKRNRSFADVVKQQVRGDPPQKEESKVFAGVSRSMAEEAKRSNTSTREVFHVPSNPPLEISEEELRYRLQRMYAKYNPSRAFKLNAVLQRALETGQEGRLLTAMVEKYGPEPNLEEELDLSVVNAATQPVVQEYRELSSSPPNAAQVITEATTAVQPTTPEPSRNDMEPPLRSTLQLNSGPEYHGVEGPPKESAVSPHVMTAIPMTAELSSPSPVNLSNTSSETKEECHLLRKEIATLEKELFMFLPATLEALPDLTVAVQQQRNLNMLVALVCLKAQRTEEERELELLSHKFQELSDQLLHC